MLHAISDRYNEFESICVELYHITRKNGNLILTMLYLLTSCELPELKTLKDLVWPSKKMMIGQTNEEAENDLKKQLKIAKQRMNAIDLKKCCPFIQAFVKIYFFAVHTLYCTYHNLALTQQWIFLVCNPSSQA